MGVDQHGEDRHQEDDRHLRRDADAKPQHEKRRKRDDRHAVDHRHPGIEQVLERRRACHDDADRMPTTMPNPRPIASSATLVSISVCSAPDCHSWTPRTAMSDSETKNNWLSTSRATSSQRARASTTEAARRKADTFPRSEERTAPRRRTRPRGWVVLVASAIFMRVSLSRANTADRPAKIVDQGPVLLKPPVA